ncbi:MAG TPA: VOC family protein [Longimicrobiales bacterium]|nr:VOC family protein [Longimicrobiales bacterium]
MMRSPLVIACVLSALVGFAAPAGAQVRTLMYDHVHMAVPDPQEAAQWYHDHIGGEWVDGRDDRLLFGRTRIMFLRGESRRPSVGGVIDHLGFSFPDLAVKLAEVEAAGATITTPMREVEGLFTLSFIEDPFGTRLELIQEPQHLGFHHVHLRGPDPEATLGWYESTFGGVRIRMRGRLDGLLYPGNVWILVTRGETFPSSEGTIDHIGWRAPEADPTLADLTARGAELTSEPRDMTLPNGQIRFFYVAGPDGARVELVQRQPDMR